MAADNKVFEKQKKRDAKKEDLMNPETPGGTGYLRRAVIVIRFSYHVNRLRLRREPVY